MLSESPAHVPNEFNGVAVKEVRECGEACTCGRYALSGCHVPAADTACTGPTGEVIASFHIWLQNTGLILKMATVTVFFMYTHYSTGSRNAIAIYHIITVSLAPEYRFKNLRLVGHILRQSGSWSARS